ncbi:FAD_binding_3 domain-containing protein [Psidium guajava]|nr:FAD_binding_3 domain-containing protein [Psidium guajava]
MAKLCLCALLLICLALPANSPLTLGTPSLATPPRDAAAPKKILIKRHRCLCFVSTGQSKVGFQSPQELPLDMSNRSISPQTGKISA